ncbi:MAG TPA: serine hydrolase [bacterium]|nr:serine hydrolase [bacterium]
MRVRMLLGFLAAAVVIVMVVVLAPSLRESPPAPAYWPTEGWLTSTPEEQGVDSALLADALMAIREKGLPVHSLLLVRNGYAVVDATFYPYDGATVHDLGSVTKSVITTLIGIAADQGKLTLDRPMLSFFAGRPVANRDARKERITVRHLVTMSSGLDCTRDENEATQRAMRASPDWVQYVLDRPVRWDPGTHFVYCSPGMHLLSAILQQATGMTALEFARANLFEPLGIREAVWPADPQGISRGAGDLKLLPRDAAKLGYLWWSRGVWEGRRIVSERWVADAVRPQIKTDGDDYYGYGWWIARAEAEGDLDSYRADGRGGQYVAVVPAFDILVATTGGGFTLDDIGPMLAASLTSMSKPLPPNPAGLAKLQAAVVRVAQPPSAAAAVLPAAAKRVAEKTFVFEANPLAIEAMRLSFRGTSEAVVHFRFAEDGRAVSWPVGLDGIHRFSPGEYGLPLGLRGVWTDESTFAVEYDSIGNNDHMFMRMRFEGDRVVVAVRDASGGMDLAGEAVTFSGRIAPR